EVVAVEVGIEVHDKIDRVVLLDLQRFDFRFSLFVVQYPAPERARAAGDNATANAVAFLVLMCQRSTHGNDAVARSGPAANGGMLQIVSRMSAFGSETHPTEFLVRPLGTALPRFVNEVRQRHKTFHTLRLLVV